MKSPEYSSILILLSITIMLFITGCNLNTSTEDKYPEPNNTDSVNNTPDGKSIQSLEKIELNDVEQWIYLRGNDTNKPVLLFLHGGPGFAMMPLLQMYNSELENHFVVVNWDQRGAGLSYSHKIPKKSMTLDQFVYDVHELTSYLKKRFNKEKIYLLGHSFGTVFGMKTISEFPDDYWAYIGVGQVVDIGENEQLSYDFALKSAQAAANRKAIRQLTGVGRPDAKGYYKNDSGYELTMKWMAYYGGDLYGKTSTEDLEDEIYDSKIYQNALDKIEKGFQFSELLFEDDAIMNIDFRTQIKKVDVPAYFISGKYDYDTPFELVEQYFNALNAPKKELIWFDNSAHFPFYEEPDKFNNVLINDILPETLNANNITGIWEGIYTTEFGDTAIHLRTLRTEDGRYSSEFSFGPTDDNSSIASGNYKMDIELNSINNSISLKGTEWIERPPAYEMINLVGIVSGNSITGSVLLQDDISEIGTFSLVKSN